MRIDYTKLEFIDPKLRKLLKWIEDRYGFEFTETSLYRIGDKGVHGTLPLRGHDLRCWDKEVGELICRQINNTWKYDPTRPTRVCAMIHDTGGGLHIHLQVHPNTDLP